jgi:Fuc2NAc and GlcNAc transferase
VVDAALIASAGLMAFATGLLLQRALIALGRRRGILAIPDHRSSHVAPTPTSGGVGFVLPVLAWAGIAIGSQPGVATALLTGGLLVALVGLWDDLQPRSASLRLTVHGLGAGIGLTLLAWHNADLIDWGSLAPWVIAGTLLIGLVWLINLYNFMDGIDGLAAGQAMVFVAGVLIVGAATPAMGAGIAVLGGAVCAFFWYNRAPARIFMGDVGSGFLGFMIGVFAVALVAERRLSAAAPVILLAPFIVDASYTLAVRAVTGQRITAPHRYHAYQRLADRIGHGAVTSSLLAYGALWLIPLAYMAERLPTWRFALLAASGIPVLALCLYHNAGHPKGRR